MQLLHFWGAILIFVGTRSGAKRVGSQTHDVEEKCGNRRLKARTMLEVLGLLVEFPWDSGRSYRALENVSCDADRQDDSATRRRPSAHMLASRRVAEVSLLASDLQCTPSQVTSLPPIS